MGSSVFCSKYMQAITDKAVILMYKKSCSRRIFFYLHKLSTQQKPYYRSAWLPGIINRKGANSRCQTFGHVYVWKVRPGHCQNVGKYSWTLHMQYILCVLHMLLVARQTEKKYLFQKIRNFRVKFPILLVRKQKTHNLIDSCEARGILVQV